MKSTYEDEKSKIEAGFDALFKELDEQRQSLKDARRLQLLRLMTKYDVENEAVKLLKAGHKISGFSYDDGSHWNELDGEDIEDNNPSLLKAIDEAEALGLIVRLDELPYFEYSLPETTKTRV